MIGIGMMEREGRGIERGSGRGEVVGESDRGVLLIGMHCYSGIGDVLEV